MGNQDLDIQLDNYRHCTYLNGLLSIKLKKYMRHSLLEIPEQLQNQKFLKYYIGEIIFGI